MLRQAAAQQQLAREQHRHVAMLQRAVQQGAQGGGCAPLHAAGPPNEPDSAAVLLPLQALEHNRAHALAEVRAHASCVQGGAGCTSCLGVSPRSCLPATAPPVQRDSALDRYRRIAALLAEVLHEHQGVESAGGAAGTPGQQLVTAAADRLGGVATQCATQQPGGGGPRAEEQLGAARRHQAQRASSQRQPAVLEQALEPGARAAHQDGVLGAVDLVEQRGVPIDLDA